MTDEIFEKLRGRFDNKKCPRNYAGDRISRKEHPELNQENCSCDDVIYTGSGKDDDGEGWTPHTFNFNDIWIAKVTTRCLNFRFQFTDWLKDPAIYNFTSKRHVAKMSAKQFKELYNKAGAREAEMLAWTDLPNYNKGCVNIRGVPFERKQLRKALMYQDSQVFDITMETYADEVPDYKRDARSMLHLIGDKHHIVVSSQSPLDTAEKIGMTSIGYD